MNQRSLFDDPCARKHGGNENSVAAMPKDAERQIARVMAAIQRSGSFGMTCDEVAVELGTTPNAVSGRFTTLSARGWIVANGKRNTRSGHAATVWVAK